MISDVAFVQTATALSNFALAMTLYPEVQRRAQAELDAVVGRDRLPTFEDRRQMPYVENVAREALRWKVVTNLGASAAVCIFVLIFRWADGTAGN